MRQRSRALVLLLGAVFSSPIPDGPVFQGRELVNVELVYHHSDHRVRREARDSNMPDLIVTQFRVSGSDVLLRLHRVPFPKMYIMGDTVEEFKHSDPLDSSVYVDSSRSGAFMVERSGYGDYKLDGNLEHRGKQLQLRPTRSRRSPDNPNEHLVYILPGSQAIDFGHDDFQVRDLDRGQNKTSRDVHDGSHRRKRQSAVTVVHTIETAFIIDFKDYSEWKRRYPNDTMVQIRIFYTYIATTVRNIYSSVNRVDSSIDIKPVVTTFVVLTTAQQSSFSETVSADADGPILGRAFLDALTKWLPTQSATIPTSDHYVCFTGYDIASAVGVANKGVCCRGAYSVSVVENRRQASTASTVAHELGHSLSASHDGDAGCDNTKQNVMTPTFFVPPNTTLTTPRAPFEFSTCSVSAFITYLGGQTCTLPAATKATAALTSEPKGQLITNLDLQCQVALDSTDVTFCEFCNQRDAMCYGMLCCWPTGSCRYVLPFDGSPCAAGKVCNEGLCVADSVMTPAATRPPSAQLVTAQAPVTTRAPDILPTTPRTAAATLSTLARQRLYYSCLFGCAFSNSARNVCYQKCTELLSG